MRDRNAEMTERPTVQPAASRRPETIYDLLVSIGIDKRKAWDVLAPVRGWFDAVPLDIASVVLPELVARVRRETADRIATKFEAMAYDKEVFISNREAARMAREAGNG